MICTILLRIHFSRMRDVRFPFMSGGLGVGLCLPAVGLATVRVRLCPYASAVLRCCRAVVRRSQNMTK